MRRLIFLIFIFSGFSIENLEAQGLSSKEKTVLNWIDQNHSSALKLLEESANINSGSLNIAGVKKVGTIYARELEKAGFTCTWISMPDSIKRAGHLVATRKGKKGKKLFHTFYHDQRFHRNRAGC